VRVVGSTLLALLLLAACDTQEPIVTPPTELITTTVPATNTSEPATTAALTTSTTSITSTTVLPLQGLAYQAVGPELAFPVLVTARPGDALSYVATKDGRVWTLEGDDITGEIGDISGRVLNQGEQGLLGMALHPEDPGLIYLHYTALNGDTVIAEYAMPNARSIDTSSERIILRLSQPAANHNGGMIAFGPHGYLFIGLGDGGGSGDVFGNGQNLDSPLGSILRIDPAGQPYEIPSDNPFLDSEAPEIWAFGLRNPWRFWIDEPAGTIYVGDVGQNAYEEINAVSLDVARGANFGWPITEALHCFSPRSGCDTTGLVLPVVEVAHGDAGTCSITGGVVYRGSAIPELFGHYFYSDYCGGWLRSFAWDAQGVTDQADWTDDVGVPGRVASFGVDGAGEIYVLTTDRVLRLIPLR